VATATLSKENLFGHNKISIYERDKGNVTATDNAVKDGYLAIVFLENADSNRFAGLWTQLKNSMLLGHNDYPSNLTSTYHLLCNYKPLGAARRSDPGAVNVSFPPPATNGTPAPSTPAPTQGNNGVLSALTFCYNCRLHGHIAHFCPSPRTTGGEQGMQFGITLAQLDHKSTGTDLISPDRQLHQKYQSSVRSAQKRGSYACVHQWWFPGLFRHRHFKLVSV
jgi:hypothetical protein